MSKGTLIITGSSRGIGAATARLAARRGYAVCVNYLQNEARADSVVAEIRESGGVAIAVRADASQESDVVRLFEMAEQQLGPISALVNNVGIVAPAARLETLTAERIVRVLITNVVSAFLCSREATKRMSTRHGGRGGAIVNVSSAASRIGSPGEYVDYAASKGAMDSLTMGHAKEVAAEGIHVNSVRPGFIHTEIHADSGDANRVERLREAIPMKRGGTPDEVAEAILWLLGDEASYVTGTFLDIAGGR